METAGPLLDQMGDVRAAVTRIIVALLCDGISAVDCRFNNKIIILNAGLNAPRQLCGCLDIVDFSL